MYSQLTHASAYPTALGSSGGHWGEIIRTSIVLCLACSVSCSDGHEATQSTLDAEPTETTLLCDQVIDGLSELRPKDSIVGDVVAFPSLTLQVGPQDLDFGQFFSKTGLIVRADSAFEIVVPEGSTTRVHWGDRDEPVQRIIVPACGGTDVWVVFAGGFFVDEATCVELIVRRPDQEDAIARIGIGVRCELD